MRLGGLYPMYVPEEIVHAAGILPVTLLGSNEPVTLANNYLQPYNCAPVRSNLDLALKGELEFVDGIIFPDICDAVTCLSDVWKSHLTSSFYHTILLPARLDSPSSRQYLIEQFAALKAHLEEFVDHEISNLDLQRSIAIYNQNRTLIARLYELRRANPGLFRARNIASVVMASMVMLKEDHNQLLNELLARAQKAKPSLNGRVRLVLSGSLCEDLDLRILDLVDEVGGVVADDDLYVGTRYFATSVDEASSPIDALAERHLRDVPCPTRHNPANDWGDHLLRLIRTAEAKGVIIVTVKFCEPHDFNYPHLMHRLSEAGIPHLLLETEQGEAPLGPIRTRLQAFVETLR